LLFFIYDGILGWDAKVVDGSSYEIGQLSGSGVMNKNGEANLPDDSPWRADLGEYMERITYNTTPANVTPAAVVDSYSPTAREINEADKLYSAGGTAPTVMITPATLHDWVTGGSPASASARAAGVYGYSKMVVLAVDSAGGYAAGHVPGAHLLDTASDLQSTRSDGVSDTVSQVATKAQMDALIQRTGINADTLVVLTGGGSNMMNVGRAYFNFRYWGFPKKRLRVLNGTAATYQAAGYPLETAAPPAPAPSTYTVCSLPQDTSVRASLEEMIAVAEDSDDSTVVIDSRSADEFNGVAGKTKVNTSTGTVVAFEGHVRTAVHQEWTTLVAPGGNGELLPVADLEAAMSAIGVDASDTAYSYCRTSWRAAVTFLALDAALGWPAKIYDGAWIEWGQMADAAKMGGLAADSPWRTDTVLRSEAVNYNVDNALTVEQLAGADSYAPQGDAINDYDSAVCTVGGGNGGGPPAPGY